MKIHLNLLLARAAAILTNCVPVREYECVFQGRLETGRSMMIESAQAHLGSYIWPETIQDGTHDYFDHISLTPHGKDAPSLSLLFVYDHFRRDQFTSNNLKPGMREHSRQSPPTIAAIFLADINKPWGEHKCLAVFGDSFQPTHEQNTVWTEGRALLTPGNGFFPIAGSAKYSSGGRRLVLDLHNDEHGVRVSGEIHATSKVQIKTLSVPSFH